MKSHFWTDSSSEILTTEENITEIEFAPSDPDIVYIATEGLTIYRSADAGVSFIQIANIRTDVLNP